MGWRIVLQDYTYGKAFAVDTKKFLIIILSYSLFGFASGPYASRSSINTNILTVQAEAGDADAQYKLAGIYKAGAGVRRNASQAKKMVQAFSIKWA